MVGKTILDKKIVQFQKPTYSFGVISDIHINRTNQDAQGDLRRAFSAFRNRGITRVFCCGDISTNHTEDELATFKSVKDEYPEITFRSCTGNHDVQFQEQQWQAYIGHGFTNGLNQLMYTEEINGDMFCLLPIRSWEGMRPYSSGIGDDPYDEFYQAFMDDLSVNGKRVFLFLHFPINSARNDWQYPGLKPGQFYGFNNSSDDTSIIKSIPYLSISQGRCKSVVMFSGHSHYAFDVQNATSDFKDVIFLQEGSLAHVHVPSLVVPRDKDMNVIQSGHPELQPAQGYAVDVYSDRVKLTGLEFNLKLFDADQRKGLVRIENRYVAECKGSLPDWLKFTAAQDNVTISMATSNNAPAVSLKYSTDGETWAPFIPGETAVTLQNANDYVYVIADQKNTRFANDSYGGGNKFQMSGQVYASGNVMSLLDNTLQTNSFQQQFAMSYLFQGCPIITAPSLPATTLTDWCYNRMFYSCTSLTQAPALPAMDLGEDGINVNSGCYNSMFADCTSLTQAPALPAMTLTNHCYDSMFARCTSLAYIPPLPATELKYNCYAHMFSNCNALSSLEVNFSSWNVDGYEYGYPKAGTLYWLIQTNSSIQKTFICPAALSVIIDGSNIPSGWTIVTK